MRILILTQKVDINDPVLGFFHGWIVEFSQYFEKVSVICLERGRLELPDNVEVFSLGKESRVSKLWYLINFYRHLWKLRKNYDRVFVHMNPEYVVLAGLFWRINRKVICLWYNHRRTDWKLRVATFLSNHVATASKEGFGMSTKKLHIVGHGIKFEDYYCSEKKRYSGGTVKIVSVGRITPIKNCDVLIEAASILKKVWNREFEIIFVGLPVSLSDKIYERKLVDLVGRLDLEKEIQFVGSVTPSMVRDFYCNSDLTVNLSPTGGTDKVVLESIASSVPVVVSNLAFADILGPYSKDFLVNEKDAHCVAKKIMEFFERTDTDQVTGYLFGRVLEKHSLKNLIPKICTILK